MEKSVLMEVWKEERKDKRKGSSVSETAVGG